MFTLLDVSELESRGYRYGKDFLPHDAKVKELGTRKTRVETLSKLGRKVALIPNAKIIDGINAARQLLPKCWFDAVKCKDGLEALRQYQAHGMTKDGALSRPPAKAIAGEGGDFEFPEAAV